ncbi:uncharacterized protein B0I36DRAFT_6482 [Microdochium trichocladiopsis]|uniref:Uncharacterized protein n=1 Tax=Microdochium trichocladiopsis TaxID=1682393 RepID=A0A9P9BVV8_9PEZI|nr:uncharacterized protein B0I36DRAFT_6482 [Microdochium trichocladiopsis]KAH7040152.1 hypothetical protein B0I36DRAFT_6482 [Microdochium trichocladiopsis]
MADATLLLDDPLSSPDPLADEIPSSVQSKTRRIAMPHHDYSMAAARSSSPMKSPSRSSAKRRSVSPRKRTFELDVGNESTPQRILVTVEADETMRSGVNRRLFPPSSPTRKIVRAEETTTRKVPLRGLSDDEGLGDDTAVTPRKRSRPRKSNGTPVPRPRKRAGTPLKPATDATRPRLELPSDASMFSDVNLGNDTDIRGSTPKPKPRARKTPAKRAPTPGAVPSSQVPTSKQRTGKKRGRPRKALMPEEVAEFAIAGSELDQPETAIADPEPMSMDDVSVTGEVRSSIENADDVDPIEHDELELQDGIAIDDDDPPSRLASERDDSVTPVPPELTILEPVFGDLVIPNRPPSEEGQPSSIHQEEAESVGVPLSDGYAPLLEPEDDGVSDVGTVESANPARQDTLTHASDFSMIAVESLPSFQASFQASFHGNLSRISEVQDEPAELGEATNMMINQTLETLRRSIQNETSADNSDEEGGDEDAVMQSGRRASPSGLSAEKQAPGSQSRMRNAWSSSPSGSPRRRKSIPLSRQVFSGKARQTDDSFSSIPDSILQAATPARFRPQQADVGQQSLDGEDQYEDSFSEIPEAILEAATPAAARQRTRDFPSGLQSSPMTRDISPEIDTGSARQSNRLPTPDDTSSSNVEPRRLVPDDQAPTAEQRPDQIAQSKSQIPSSPPNIVVQRLESLEARASSQRRDPHREIPESPQMPSFSETDQGEPPRNLEPPPSSRRPTLSPIVRVARTLQSVMSDKSSPEGLESNLGSPFRGSHSRQSSITKSPTRNASELFGRSTNNQMPPFASASSRENRQSISQSARSGSQHDRTRSLDNLFGPQINTERQDPNARLQAPASKERTPERRGSVPSGPMSSSTKSLLPSDDRMSWVAEDSPLRARSITRQSITQALRESSLAASRKRDSLRKSPPERSVEMNRGPSSSPQRPDPPITNEEDDILLDAADDDIWDFEASRPESRQVTASAVPRNPHRMSDEPRRGKIPSPWSSHGRHNMDQEEIDSPSQILLDESPQKRLGPSAPEYAQNEEHRTFQRSVSEEEEEDEEEEGLPSPPRSQQQGRASETAKDTGGSEYSLLQDQDDAGRMPSERSVESVNVEEYSLIAPQLRQTGARKNSAQPVMADGGDEHSLVARDNEEHPDPPPAKSRFFGGFDIMSFFSSPSALPSAKDPKPTSSNGETAKPKGLPSMPPQDLPGLQPQKAQSSLWATGLFPSIAQKEFRPSPERGNTLFSSSAPASSARVDPDTSPTPTPRSRDLPSTPERQAFPTIEQKRDFTPRSGQNGSALFTGRAAPAPTLPAIRVPSTVAFLNPSNSRQDHDTSIATEDSEYERVPPREIPSRWDKTLSPSKSSFRSPMKPTTPGRVVAFTKNVVFPDPPSNGDLPRKANAPAPDNTSRHVFLQPPPQLLQPRLSGQENELRSRSAANAAAARVQRPQREAPVDDDGMRISVPPRTGAAETNRFPQPKAFALTGTSWTKAHWVRFDEILQLRRKNVQQFRRDHPYASSPGDFADDPIDCNDDGNYDDEQASSRPTSRGGKILGKQVSGQGASMLIESWHLEVIKAFMQEIDPCPWDEMVLAKRLFALIVGEERRRNGAVKPSATRASAQMTSGQRVNLGARHRA